MSKPQLVHKGTHGKFTFEVYQVEKTRNLEKGKYFYKFKVYQPFQTKNAKGEQVTAKDYAIPGFMKKEFLEALDAADNYARSLASSGSADAITAAANALGASAVKDEDFSF